MLIVRSIWPRILCAATKMPRLRDWLEASALLAGVGAAAWLLGFQTGMLTLRPETDIAALAFTALVALAIPALGEEAVFRAPLSARAAWIAVSLALFVAWHPAQLALGLPWAQAIFADPRFLGIAAVLGVACTASRLRSGSLWPAVAIHWASIVGWRGLTGG